MRRSVARGRVFPQSYSTDRRYGRLSLKAVALFPLMWVNADDQGRLCGDPEEIKYAVCPNIDHITKADIPGLLQELHDNKLILRYDTPKSAAIQILDWWDPHRAPQWAWPSDYPPPKGWQDHLRYKKDAHTVETLNWPLSGEHSGEDGIGSQVSGNTVSGERSGETAQKPLPFPHTPIPTPIKGSGTGGGIGRGNSPEDSPESSGEKPSPSPGVLSLQEKEIFDTLKENYCMRWGTVHADNLEKVIPRPLTAKVRAQLRDLAIEISAAGGCQPDTIKQAFDEAGVQRKYSISYFRAVLLDWMGIERIRSP